MAEDIDFKFPLKSPCTSEIKLYWPDVQHGHANIIRSALPLAYALIAATFHAIAGLCTDTPSPS